jgi:hypothetical protein
MRHFATIPLTIIPLIIYLIVAFSYGSLTGHPDVWDEGWINFTMMSGGKVTLLNEHLVILAGLVCLFFEIWKATRQTNQEAFDQVLSMLVFIVYLVLFITLSKCSHAAFFILMVISLIDVVAGFLVAMRAARRSLSVENDIMP